MTGDVLGDAKARLVLARLQIGTGGGTDGASVELGDAQALCGESIELRRLVEGIPIAAQICPAEVICQDEDDIGGGSGEGKRARGKKEPCGQREGGEQGSHERRKRWGDSEGAGREGFESL